MTPTCTIKLEPGREKKIRSFYPWVQKGEIRRVEGGRDAGLARVEDHEGNFLGIGAYNPVSRFPVRMLSLIDRPIDSDYFRERIGRAWSSRQEILTSTNSVRAISSEADAIPGLIVDVYDGHGVVQVRSQGMELLRDAWTPVLIETLGLKSLYEKSDMAGRSEEGLDPVTQVLHGEPPFELEIEENGLSYLSLVKYGLKTGFYLDQRAARARLRSLVKPGDRVLDCFSYVGGFSLAAAAGGAQVRAVDILPAALQAADRMATKNGLAVDFVESNAFEYLEAGGEKDGLYDWIILDPPAIAKTKEKRDSLKWGIWKLVFHAIPMLKPGGRLVVFSCSYQLNLQTMLDTCRLAASDRGEQLDLVEISTQDTDHPAPLAFPEALYLKGAWLKKRV
ncbi:MAG: class I SAM-dependent rRNA methyltransferase [Fimbriimonadaceae bacterium]|nr:class I SAM-dependent rRNA methyltransferase [Fimbriimonadaceae bacterium]